MLCYNYREFFFVSWNLPTIGGILSSVFWVRLPLTPRDPYKFASIGQDNGL